MYQFHKSDRFPYLMQRLPIKNSSTSVFYGIVMVLGSLGNKDTVKIIVYTNMADKAYALICLPLNT